MLGFMSNPLSPNISVLDTLWQNLYDFFGFNNTNGALAAVQVR